MAKCFIFDVFEEQCDRIEYSTVIFVEGPIVSVKDFRFSIDAHIADGIYARNPTIIGSSYIKEELNIISKDPQFIDLFALGGKLKPQILIFDEHGTFFEIKDDEEEVFKNNELINTLRRQGITTLVNRNEGIIETADTFHYVKPSDRHARRFIRTADIFKDSVELSFLAIWLMPYLKAIDVIHCDTAAIFPIVQQAIILRNQLSTNAQLLKPIRVSSFGSYSNLKDYDFHADGIPLVVISASTSDSLRESLAKDCAVKSSNIITIVGIGTFKEERQLICNATKDRKLNPHGSDEIKSWNAKECPECQHRSLAIRIQGDSFMPTLPAEKKFLIRRTNVPEWLTATLDFFKEYQVLSGFLLNQSGQPRDINFDLSKAFSNLDTNLPDKIPIQTKLQFILPASATKIVVLVDGGALALANTIKGYLEKNYSKNPIDIISVEKLRDPEWKMESWVGTVIVVTGLITSPRELLAISRDLRRAKCPIVYIIGLASFPSAQTYKLCCLDLSQRFDEQKNQVHNLLSIFLSLSMEDYSSAWEREKTFLKKILENSELKLTSRQYFDSRQERLGQRVEGERGLEEVLFLDAPRGTKLKLNPNFSLVKRDTDAEYYNQSEVLFAVSATLHNIRFGAESEPNLFRAVCQRIVLSPRNFDRYNDAVIQAALLRLAHSIEIDYSFSKPMSDDIADIIIESARHLDEESSDALPEFLLALAMNRLRLHPYSLEKIKSQIEGSLTKDAGIVQDLFLILKSIIIQQPTRGC